MWLTNSKNSKLRKIHVSGQDHDSQHWTWCEGVLSRVSTRQKSTKHRNGTIFTSSHTGQGSQSWHQSQVPRHRDGRTWYTVSTCVNVPDCKRCTETFNVGHFTYVDLLERFILTDKNNWSVIRVCRKPPKQVCLWHSGVGTQRLRTQGLES